MKASFLGTLAQKLLHRYGENGIQDLQLLFPNRRSPLFFLKALAEHSDRPLWAPSADSLDDFLPAQMGYGPADHVDMLLILYYAHLDIAPKEGFSAYSFEDFSFWGEIILSDFEEMDAYQQDPKKLFVHIKAFEDVDAQFADLPEEHRRLAARFWEHFLRDNHTAKRKFLPLWNALPLLYECLHEALEARKISYQSHLLRHLAEAPEKYPQFFRKRLIFVGFHALSRVERHLITHCLEQHNAEIHWDVDASYVAHPRHEAGYFFRNYQKDATLASTLPQLLPSQSRPLSFRIQEMQSPIMQVKMAINALQKYRKRHPETPLERIVILLPNENMLLPLLHALPLCDINISMGHRLSFTPIRDLLHACVALFALSSAKKSISKDVWEPLLTHPYLMLLRRTDLSKQEPPSAHLEAENKYLDQYPSFVRRLLFSADGVLKRLKILSEGWLLFAQEEDPSTSASPRFNRLDRLYFEALQDLLTGAEDAGLDVLLNELTPRSQSRILDRLLAQHRIPFTGEPLRGLQIMGMRETRNLDFDYVIALDMNEDNCPPATQVNTLVPQKLRRAYGLPTYAEKSAAHAYIFYRLLHRSAEVDLFYLSSQVGEGTEKKQKSRFLYQLEYDSPHNKLPSFPLGYPLKIPEPRPVEVQKTEELWKKWRQTQKNDAYYSLHVSALNDYLACPMHFYYKHLQKLEQPTSTDHQSRIDFGKCFHNTVEALYKPLIGKNLSESLLTLVEEQASGALMEQIKKIVAPRAEKFNGKLKLMHTVLLRYLKQVIRWDKQRLITDPAKNLRIYALEKKLSRQLTVETDQGNKSVHLYGRCDRIDQAQASDQASEAYIIDYKTAKIISAAPKTTAELFEQPDKNKNYLQLALYAWMGQNDMQQSTSSLLVSPIQLPSSHPRAFSYPEQELTAHLRTCLADFLSHSPTFAPRCEKCVYDGLCFL